MGFIKLAVMVVGIQLASNAPNKGSPVVGPSYTLNPSPGAVPAADKLKTCAERDMETPGASGQIVMVKDSLFP